MKKILAAFIVTAAVLVVPFNSYALQKLPAPSEVKWSDSTKGMATWAPVEGAEKDYGLELYRNGELWQRANHLIIEKESWKFGGAMSQSGTYTFRAKAYGDGVNYDDSEWSEFSEPYVYNKPEQELGAVRHVHWLENGVVTWEPPLSVPDEYANNLAYEIRLYTNDKSDKTKDYITKTQWSMLDMMTEDDAVYKVRVRALSPDIEHISNGPGVYSEEYLDTKKLGTEASEKLDTLLNDLETGNESASNAAKKLDEMDLKNTAAAVQANPETRESLKKLEEWYLDNTGTTVNVTTGEDTGLNTEDIEVIGAGLNVESPSNAVNVSISKPAKATAVDPKDYKNLVQFDIHLEGAKSGELRSPIVIVMPVPEGVKGSRLWILHHHQDGSYETIYPTQIDNDTKVRFTVTSLSIFSFVTDPDESEDTPQEPTSPSRPYTPSTSSESESGSSYTQAAETNGEWVVGEKGWWYRFKDGTYPSNGWMQLEWGGKSDWYYFNAEGYMVSGWITDVDGHRYFLHDQMDGTQGYMYTGWHQIDGKWYYFSTVSGGPLGSLLINTTTPDGYAVGADGVWIQ